MIESYDNPWIKFKAESGYILMKAKPTTALLVSSSVCFTLSWTIISQKLCGDAGEAYPRNPLLKRDASVKIENLKFKRNLHLSDVLSVNYARSKLTFCAPPSKCKVSNCSYAFVTV